MGYIALDVNNLRRGWRAPSGSTGGPGRQRQRLHRLLLRPPRRSQRERQRRSGDRPVRLRERRQSAGRDGDPTAATPRSRPAKTSTATARSTAGAKRRTSWILVGTDQLTAWTGSGYNAPFNATARPWTDINVNNAGQARMNRQVLFRRALKLVNAGICAAGSRTARWARPRCRRTDLTVASENPVYVQGNYNAGNDPVTDADRGARAGRRHRRRGDDSLQQLEGQLSRSRIRTARPTARPRRPAIGSRSSPESRSRSRTRPRAPRTSCSARTAAPATSCA